MADLVDVIGGAVDAAWEGGNADESGSSDGDALGSSAENDTSDSSESVGGGGVSEGTGETGGDSEGSATDAAAGVSGSVSDDTAAAKGTAKPPVLDELDKELEAEGIKKHSDATRENRIPYSRVRKIVENTKKRLSEAHTTALSTKETEYRQYKTKADQLDLVDRMIATDDDRYMRTLAILHPEKYSKYLNREPVAAKPATDPDEGKPQPDYKFDDGTFGYTDKQHQRLMEWYGEKARKQAVAEVEQRFKPLEDRFKSEETNRQLQPLINAQLAQARKAWGKYFEDDYKKGQSGQSEIIAFMAQNPDVEFHAAVAMVLGPKKEAELAADRTKIREEVHAELNARPHAVQRLVPGSKRPVTESSGERTLEDVIRESIATL
jgi:hypothetical protein